MNNFMFKNLPSYVEKEVQIIMEHIKPLLKKNSRFLMFSVPMITLSVLNLLFLLVMGAWTSDMMPILAIYALVAAIGIALFKESRMIRHEIQKLGIKHIIERIKNSEHVNNYQKKEYINSIHNQPNISLYTFIQFLMEENQRRQRFIEN